MYVAANAHVEYGNSKCYGVFVVLYVCIKKVHQYIYIYVEVLCERRTDHMLMYIVDGQRQSEEGHEKKTKQQSCLRLMIWNM